MKKLAVFVIFVFLAAGISVVWWHQLYSKTVPRFSNEWFFQQHPAVPETYVVMMFFCMVLMCAYIIQLILVNTRIPIPYQVFMLASASVWGVIMYYNEVPLLFSKAIDVPMVDVALLYVPAAIFNISFCMDVPIFFKSIPQILIIGLPVAGLTGIFNGILMRQLINDKWPLAFGFFFGLLCIPTNPKFIGYLLKEQSLRTKHIGVLLEGEALISFVLGDYLYLLTVSYMSKHVVHWYQIISVILRFVVMGILEGLLFGMMGRYLVRKMSWNKLSMFSIFFVMPFLCFSFAFNFGSGCGTTGVAILGLIMGLERTTLSREAEKYLTNFWEGLGFIMDVLLCVRCAVDAMIYVVGKVEWSHYVLILVVYLVYYVTRFSCYLLFLPLLSRLGYGMDFKNMMICVWCGIKNPLSLLMVASMAVIDVSRSYDEIWRLCFFFFLGLYTLSNLINGSLTRNLLNFMGFRTISMSRQANMSNCIKHIFNKRQRTIDILKMDRFLADNDWSLIRKICTIEHPYHIDLTTEEEEQLFLGYRYTYCPECKKDVEEQPTAKEIKEIMKEAQMRVLKAKKICYTRQFERGMVSKPGMRLLSQALEVELDTGEIYQVNLDNVEKQFRLNICQRLFRKLLLRIQRLRTSCLRPKTYWRRVCYYLVIKTSYLDILMFVIVILNIVVIGIDWRYHSTFTTDSTHLEPSHKLNYVITTIKLTFIFVYFSEFIIKVMAYSRRSICADGLKRYFKSLANTIDVMIIFILIVNVTFVTNETVNLSHNHERSEEEETVHLVFSWLQLLVIVKLAVVLRIFNPLLLNCLERKADAKMALAYDICKSYAMSNSEVLEMLPYLIDNKQVREEVKMKLNCDRVLITKMLGLIQKEKPWVAITVKTKQAIRTILSNMSEAVNHLRVGGWIDNFEQEKLLLAMDVLYDRVNAIEMVQPSAPKVIFKEVAWMAEDEDVINFLFENVTVKKFDTGDVVFDEGDVADGIYIVVTGLFVITYKPNKNCLESLHEYGKLPIVDYLSGTKYEDSAIDYIVSGNCIGELSFLTGRPYNCTIQAEAPSQVYVLSSGVLRRAMELNPDPIIGLESRIWKEVSIRVAAPLLQATPAYQSLTQEQVKFALERAFVPNLNQYKIFSITDMIEDIIIVDGLVADYNTRETYIAPCCVSRTVQKIILPTSSLINVPFEVVTRLLIVPDREVDEYDVMMLAEETCEMLSTGSESKCLQHTAQERIRNRKRNRSTLRHKFITKQKSSHTSSRSVPQSLTSSISTTYSRSRTGSITKGNVSFHELPEEQEIEKDSQRKGSMRSSLD
ncbi:solute carrier family 9 member C1 isoform X2 [Tribolium castaneum]|nr:PREDICTED: sodium/hydrogen exchanger 10 isoform X2 [Tribolium castaneum]|eukprot:XP_008199758.2 PREDICTED: sodium/hydrogen exchanger 10 isoform X2 [Tribolium castaneum]